MTICLCISVFVLVLLKLQLSDLVNFPQACLLLDLQTKKKFLLVLNYLIVLQFKPL